MENHPHCGVQPLMEAGKLPSPLDVWGELGSSTRRRLRSSLRSGGSRLTGQDHRRDRPPCTLRWKPSRVPADSLRRRCPSGVARRGSSGREERVPRRSSRRWGRCRSESADPCARPRLYGGTLRARRRAWGEDAERRQRPPPPRTDAADSLVRRRPGPVLEGRAEAADGASERVLGDQAVERARVGGRARAARATPARAARWRPAAPRARAAAR